MTSVCIRRKVASLMKYFMENDPYKDILSKEESARINRDVAKRIAKKRCGRRGRR